MPTCANCGYDLGGLNPTAGATKCPQCAHTFSGERPAAHVLYRRRWLVGFGWCVCAAILWGIEIARTANGWGQIGLVAHFSAAPGIVAGLVAGISTMVGGRILTPAGIRAAAGLRWATLLVDMLLVALGTIAMGVVACYLAGGIAAHFWGAGGC